MKSKTAVAFTARHHPPRKSRSEKRPTLNVQSAGISPSQWPTRAIVGGLSNGSCQCLLTIPSILLEGCFGAATGNAIATDLTDLTSGAASFVYAPSSLSAFVDGSFWSFVSAVTFSDERQAVPDTAASQRCRSSRLA